MERKSNFEDESAALFALPLSEFISARNALAARLKREKRSDEADKVKALAKPTVSAWAVNQLYWKHRQAFDQLMQASQRFREAQASQLAGKTVDVKGPGDERRDALAHLSRLAASLLQDSGHSATPEMIRRVSTTLEAVSALAALPNSPLPGHLTADVDPPGFDALAALIPGAASPTGKVISFRERKAQEEANAERLLREARTRIKDAETALKEAVTKAKEAEKRKREAESLFQKASAAADEATKAVADAERTFEAASAKLKSLS